MCMCVAEGGVLRYPVMPIFKAGQPSRDHLNLVWFDFCFMALQHILGHFGQGQLP